tara:strand:- start:71 stop:397 length:327 start_codon:yes stop_codon:yes gene_type:complete
MNKYSYNKKKYRYYKLVLYSIYFLFFGLILLFSETGYIESKKIQNKNLLIEKNIKKEKEKLNQLEKEKIRLEEDLNYIEKIAREEFKMAKKGEKVFTIVNKKENKGYK